MVALALDVIADPFITQVASVPSLFRHNVSEIPSPLKSSGTGAVGCDACGGVGDGGDCGVVGVGSDEELPLPVTLSVVVTAALELLRSFGDLRMVFYALMLILLMILRPQGLMGSREIADLWRKYAGRRA